MLLDQKGRIENSLTNWIPILDHSILLLKFLNIENIRRGGGGGVGGAGADDSIVIHNNLFHLNFTSTEVTAKEIKENTILENIWSKHNN